MLSFEASNALLWLTYGVFAIFGVSMACRLKSSLKGSFLAANGTATALPLMMNFIASNLGTVPFLACPQLATQAGLHGLLVFILYSSFPLLFFAYLGSLIRRQCPDGFVLTEWTRQRFGSVAAIYLSIVSTVCILIFGVSEIAAVSQSIAALTGREEFVVPAVIVEVVVTTIYTSIGGFKITFITDYVQGILILLLITVLTVVIGTQTKIDTSLIQSSGLLQPTLVGWQILWILTAGGIPAYFLLSNFWMRAFASRSDRDLWLGCIGAMVGTLLILVPVGITGLLAAWSGPDLWPGPDDANLDTPMFALLHRLPDWTSGLTLIVLVCLSTACFGSLQCGMVSTVSNDVFRNRLNIWWVRCMVAVGAVPMVILALKATSVLVVWFVCFLLSGAICPILFFGLSKHFYFLRGFDVVAGGLGGIFCIFVFGTVWYGDAYEGGRLLILQQGIYSGDWAVFGAFVAAPVGSFAVSALAVCFRLGVSFVSARFKGVRFAALDRPSSEPVASSAYDVNRIETGPGRMDEKTLESGIARVDSETLPGVVQAGGLRPNVVTGSFW